MAKNVHNYQLTEPLGSVTAAKVDINAGDGNMTIDTLTSGEQVLANGTLQYLEKQGLPTSSVITSSGQADLTVRAGHGKQRWLHLPWEACNGATEWQVHLSPRVTLDIHAHTDGGNVKLDLAGLAVNRISADTGGGNMELILPRNAVNLQVVAKSGAGNVTVQLPGTAAARIHATSGLGKIIVDSRINKIDKNTYQTADYERADHKVELTLSTGAGNVTVSSN